MITKFQIEHWDHTSSVKVFLPYKKPFRTRTDISVRLPKSPGDVLSLDGVQSSKRATGKHKCLHAHPMNDNLGYFNFPKTKTNFGTPM